MNEATCKAAVAKLLRANLTPRGGVVFRHEDTFTGGIPDLSASFSGRTVWAEFKLDRPGRRSNLTALQADALMRLRGLEVHYVARGADGTLEVYVWAHASGKLIAHAVGRPAAVHRTVSNAILERLTDHGRF